MAPRRSGGGGSFSSGSSSNTCPGAFSYWTSQASLAYYIIFLIMFFGISFGFCVIRKRSGPGKSLIGVVYVLALLFAIVSLALDMVTLVLTECEAAPTIEYTNINIASTLLYHLSCLGLLFTVFYKLNSMLRSRLGSAVKPVRILLLTMFGIMTVLYIAYIVLSSYVSSNDLYYFRDEAEGLVVSSQRLSMTIRCFYLLCVLVSTVLALSTVTSLRRAHIPGGDLIGWVLILHLFMLIWTVLAVVIPALAMYPSIDIPAIVSLPLAYLLTFFQTLSFIPPLFIAKHVCWSQDAAAMHHHHHHQPQVYESVPTAYGYGDSEFVGRAK